LRVLEETARECAHWRGARPNIDTFDTGAQLLDAVRSGNGYEYIFLDIEMPELTGIDIYSELFELSHSSIVFVSAYVKYLPEAFALDAYGFLAKPYDQDTFDRTVKSVMDQKAETQFFRYTSDGVDVTMPCGRILLFSIVDYVLTMYCINGDSVVLPRKNLDEVVRELSERGFYRCSRSTLVNLRYCTGRNKSCIVFSARIDNAGQINISRRKLKEFDERLILYRMGGRNAF
jgi:DNA-binding LytR/AlgR family response regulator